MGHKKRERESDIKRFGPKKLSYNEILEMELSKIKEYVDLLTSRERELVFAAASS